MRPGYPHPPGGTNCAPASPWPRSTTIRRDDGEVHASRSQGLGVEAVIFDFDGLLMDTESTSLESWQYEWEQWGLSLEVSEFFVAHGGDVTDERYAKLAAAVGEGYDQGLSHRRRLDYRKQLHQELDIAPGIRDWLDEAVDLHLRLAVASSSPMEWLREHLGRAEVLDRFEVLAAGDEVVDHKPAPDVYRLALSKLAIDASRAVAVEDTGHGVTAAKASGLRCIAIPNPFVTPEQVGHADLLLPVAHHLPLTEALLQL